MIRCVLLEKSKSQENCQPDSTVCTICINQRKNFSNALLSLETTIANKFDKLINDLKIIQRYRKYIHYQEQTQYQ
jgi:hypothetical protein